MIRAYELVMVKGNTGYMKAPVLIPFYLLDANHCIIMDTGKNLMREGIVKTLEENPDIRYCPHGRPITIVMKKSEIERQFGRA